jgi:tRNA(Ile)-lysidine synthase TilS/MesJ
MIYVYNSHDEDHTSELNNFYIARPSPLSNPFTHNGVRTSLATLSFKTRDEAIEAYKKYFEKMYGSDEEFTKAFDEIYEHYKNGEDVYLQCFCKPKPCHGDYIAEQLQRKLVKEKLKERKKQHETHDNEKKS